MSAWERVTSQGEFVYWRKKLADGSWLAVAKELGIWRWSHRGPKYRDGVGELHATGLTPTVRAAKTTAERAAREVVQP